MKAVLLGGSGFIGAHLTRALVDDGERVVVVDRQMPSLAPVLPEATYLLTDFTAETRPDFDQALAGADTLYHLAWRMLPAASNNRPIEDVRSNLVGALRLLDDCVRAGVRRIIFFSSGGTIYGPAQQLPIPETHPTDPRSSHAIAKLAVEKYLSLYHQMYGLEYVILRPANPYGPYQDPCSGQGVVATFLALAQANEPLDIWGDGSSVRDYFYVSDLARCAVLAGRTPHAQRTYNVGSGIGRTLLEVIDGIRAVTGREVAVRMQPGRQVDVAANVLDISRAREMLEWSPLVSFEEGLRLTWEANLYPQVARRRRG